MTQEELFEKLKTRKGQEEVLALAASLVAHSGAERIDVERSKALRQCVEQARKFSEADEIEELVARNERAASRMENPDAPDAAGEGAPGAEGVPGESGEVH